MAQRALPITRDDLLHRLARVSASTYGGAHELSEDWSDERLRDTVERYEDLADPEAGGLRRRGFAASQPTTTLQGQTR